jgi:hypothetical protein
VLDSASTRTLLALLVLACATRPDTSTPHPAFEVDRIAQDVAWLADDEREGRGIATEGLADAARYVARGFEAAGLEPGGSEGSYLQSFEVPVAIRVEKAELSVSGVALERGTDFEPLLTSRSTAVEADLVFAGYGISDDESGWDDYAGVDVEGRLVLVLDDRPQLEDGALGGVRGARFLRRAYKIANARRHGAEGVLLAPAEDVVGLPANAGREDANPMRQESEVLALAVSRAAARRLVAGGGASLEARQAAIAAAPASVLLPGVRVRVAVENRRDRGAIENVVGILPGSDPAFDGEAVVIGAHLDHLGRGEYGSLAPERRGEVHNGANDNASGTAGLLALARALAAGPPTRRSIVLVAFTAEEVGLAGSAHYVAHPEVPVADTVAMVNLDMIGRLEGAPITVFGAESGRGFQDLVDSQGEHLGTEISFSQGAFAPSDQTSFHAQGVPVLFFFSGTHSEYHTPDDDPERVDVEGIATIAALVERVAPA